MGLGILLAAAIPSAALTIIGVVALRGSTPAQRPEIIRALAELIGAMRRGRDSPPRTRGKRSIPSRDQDESGEQPRSLP